MNKTPVTWLVGVLLVLCAAGVQAEKADRDKPMNIEADALRYDEARQTSVFTGRVVLTKGTIVIRGGKLDVRQDDDGYQYGVVTAEPGKLAFFRQKREGVDEFIEGEGETIHYDGRADTVKFTSQAQLRRYQGSTLFDQFNAAVIVYNNLSEVFTLDGAPVAGKGGVDPSGTPRGRVRAMLTPKADKGATPAPAASAATPLRETPALGGSAP